MRNLGFVLLVAGVAGFFYCSSQTSRFEPLPMGLGVSEALQTERGKWEAGRYACVAGAFMGILLAMTVPSFTLVSSIAPAVSSGLTPLRM